MELDFGIFKKTSIDPDDESIQKALRLLPEDLSKDLTICQRLRWMKEQNKNLYEKTKEPICLAMILICGESEGMAKKMNNKLVEYKDKENQREEDIRLGRTATKIG